MNHQEAQRREAVEKYLLEELPPPERDEFEEHFFDCQECASDLKTTAAFIDEAKRQLGRAPAAAPAPRARPRFRFEFLWRPAFAAPAFALLLAVILYQNLLVSPRVAGAGASADHPEVLSAVSLIGANSRGGEPPSATVSRGQPLLLTLDIPAAQQYASYSCALVAPSGAIVGRVPVSAAQAKDTVSIRIPPGDWTRGDYTLLVQDYASPARGEPTDIARYRFALNIN